MADSRIKLVNIGFESFEEAEPFVLKLYITGATSRSCRAVANLKKFCEEHIAGRYELEVIDIYQFPELARQEQIIAAPTLVKKHPNPRKLFIGDLSDPEWIRKGLGLSS